VLLPSSNQHALQHSDLNAVCLPISPQRPVWSARMDSNHQQYHTKSLADFQGTRTLCTGCLLLFTVSALTHYLVDIVGIEPTHPEGTGLQPAATLLLRRMSIIWWLVEVTLLCLMIISHSFYF